jgi:hypothetical protein
MQAKSKVAFGEDHNIFGILVVSIILFEVSVGW